VVGVRGESASLAELIARLDIEMGGREVVLAKEEDLNEEA